MIDQKTLDKIELEALKRNIPVMQKEGLDFMISLLNEEKAATLLEIGSAIGYSAMRLVTNVDQMKVETIELDDERYQEAKENIEKYKLQDQIYLHHDNALTFDESQLVIKSFDALFIDAAKAQYQRFFEKYIPYIKEDGIVIVDNLDFHGMVDHIEEIRSRNTRQLVKKIKRFRDWIFDHELYDAHYYPVGDGIVVVKRKEKA